jgi:mannose-1-phosphate guanylyltransferase
MYVFDPVLVDEVSGPPPQDIGYDLLPKLVGRATTVVVDGYLRDIGTWDAYRHAELEWMTRSAG